MIQRRTLMAGLFGGAAAAGLSIGTAEAAPVRRSVYNAPSLPQPSGMVFFGGCIRFESMTDGPYIHANSAHTSVGLSSVVVMADGDVRVTFDRKVPVVTGFIDEDESFAVAGISAGFSGGQGIINLRFGLNGTRLLPTDSRLWKANRNLWIGVFGLEGATV